MAKFAREDAKPFSPIDSKLLGGLAETPPAEPLPPVQTPQARPVAPPEATAVERKQSPPQRTWPQPEAKPLPVPSRAGQPAPERLTRVVKCLFTASEEQELRNLVNRLREKTGITLSFSHLIRPFFDLLLQSEHQLGEELAHAGLRRPINDQNALAAFERELALVIHEALRKTDTRTTPERP